MKALIFAASFLLLTTQALAEPQALYDLETAYTQVLPACKPDRFVKTCKQAVITALEAKLKQSPDDYEALLLLGSKLFARNQQDRPINLLTQALQLQPQRSEAWTARAQQLFELQLYSQALADAKQALSLNHKDTEALRIQADSYQALNQLESAIQIYSRLLERETHSANYFSRAEIYSEIGLQKEAEADLKLACVYAEPSTFYCGQFWDGESEAELEQVVVKVASQLRQAQTEMLRLKQLRDAEPDNEAKAQAVTDYLLQTYNLYLKHLWAMLGKYTEKNGSVALERLLQTQPFLGLQI